MKDMSHLGRRLAPFAVALLIGAVASTGASAQQAAAAAPAPDSVAVADLPLTETERKTYAATYKGTSPEGRELALRVYEENGVLLATMNASEPSALLSQGKHVFRPKLQTRMSLTFSVDGQRATKVTVHRGPNELELFREP